MPVRNIKGFTLIELIVVIAIAGILVAIGVPSFTNLTKDSRIRSEANGLMGALAYARTEAIRRGNTVHFGRRNGTDMSGGAVVWIDADGDNSWDAGEEIRLWEPFKTTIAVTTANTYLSFNSIGMANATADFDICDNRTGETGRTLSLLVSGVSTLTNLACT